MKDFRKQFSQQINNQHGATMIEFALAFVVFLLIIGGIFDIGISLHRKSMLTLVSKEVSRKLSIELANTLDCSSITNTINAEGKAYAQQVGVPVNSWQFRWHNSGNTDTFSSFNLTLSSQVQCFFLCNIFPNGLTPISSIETTVSVPSSQLTCSDVTI